MRTTLIAAVLLAASVAGCASAPQPRQSKERVVLDTDKIAAIDKLARATGVDVHWINPPRKRVREP